MGYKKQHLKEIRLQWMHVCNTCYISVSLDKNNIPNNDARKRKGYDSVKVSVT